MASENAVVNKMVKVLDSKKAKDIQVLKVDGLTTLTDYFVIATGGSDTQVKALCDNVEEELDKDGIFKNGIEGYSAGQWILLGYDDVILHIFLADVREFYGLEHVWQDAERVDISDIITE